MPQVRCFSLRQAALWIRQTIESRIHRPRAVLFTMIYRDMRVVLARFKQVSMMKEKTHNHRPQTNLRHRQEETQNTESSNSKYKIDAKQPNK